MEADILLAQKVCRVGYRADLDGCYTCALAKPMGRAGLLWVGEAYYKTPHHWTREAHEMGVSRRIAAVPKGFLVGETWVLLAHRKAIVTRCCRDEDCVTCGGQGLIEASGIFSAFRPTAIEYVVRGSESTEEIDRLLERGMTPVQVSVQADQIEVFEQY